MVVWAGDGPPLARTRHVRLEVAARDENVAVLRAREEFERARRVVRPRRVGSEHLLTSLVRALHGAEVALLFMFEQLILRLERLVAVRQLPAVILQTRVRVTTTTATRGRGGRIVTCRIVKKSYLY